MRAIIQRVQQAKVDVDETTVGQIEKGYLVLLGVSTEDTFDDATYISSKISGLRIFEDAHEKMNLTLHDVGGKVLLVSQFTLFGDARKGRRPSFIKAAGKEKATELLAVVKEQLESEGLVVQEGQFAAHMMVHLVNDGPVTILLDSERTF